MRKILNGEVAGLVLLCHSALARQLWSEWFRVVGFFLSASPVSPFLDLLLFSRFEAPSSVLYEAPIEVCYGKAFQENSFSF